MGVNLVTNKKLLKEIKLRFPEEYNQSFEEEIQNRDKCAKCNSNEYITVLVYDDSSYISKKQLFDHGLIKMNDCGYEGPDRYCRKCKNYFIHITRL